FPEILDGATNIVSGGVGEIQGTHQVFGFLGVEADLSTIQVRHERAVSGRRQKIGHTLDLIVEAPPFLYHYNRWCAVSGIRFNIKSRAFASIRSLERNHHAE